MVGFSEILERFPMSIFLLRMPHFKATSRKEPFSRNSDFIEGLNEAGWTVQYGNIFVSSNMVIHVRSHGTNGRHPLVV